MEAKTRILKGCCSCQHRTIRADGTRVCAKMQLVVGQKFRCGLCSLWEMSKQAQLAGWSQGRVKRKEYLEYLLRECEDWKIATQLGLHVEMKSVEELRMKFEQEHGSIYINF